MVGLVVAREIQAHQLGQRTGELRLADQIMATAVAAEALQRFLAAGAVEDGATRQAASVAPAFALVLSGGGDGGHGASFESVLASVEIAAPGGAGH